MKRHLDELRRATEEVDLDALRAGLPQDLSSLREPESGPESTLSANNSRWWIATLGLVAAAALALVVMLPAEPQPGLSVDEPAAQPAGPEPFRAELATGRVQVGEHVVLLAEGSGRVEGTTMAPGITWDEGLLRVEVEPHQGVELSVLTAESQVRVRGTVFEVERGAMGTTVRLERGSVGVVCAQEAELLLQPGQEHSCVAWTAARRLGKANEALASGDFEAALAHASAGSELEGSDIIRSELLAARFHALHELGRQEAALEAAELYLASPKAPRAAEVCALVQAQSCP